MTPKKCYISGKISGLDFEEVKRKFSNASIFIHSCKMIPVNPIDIGEEAGDQTWNGYMIMDIEALMTCDAIYMLNDWGSSKGARIEYAIAKELELTIIHQPVI